MMPSTEPKTEEKDFWAELRKPFPAGTVGKLPKPYKADSPKGKCTECGGYHGLPAVHLDYIGHAAITDRLNTVAPDWTWEPMALDTQGAPALDKEGNLWIKLHINGVTRLGVGDGKNMKERIGDALRNAAMRFGVALDLWTKDELESTIDHPEAKNDKSGGVAFSDKAPDEPSRQVTDVPLTPLTKDVLKEAIQRSNRFKSVTEVKGFYYDTIGKEAPTTEADAEKLIKTLEVPF